MGIKKLYRTIMYSICRNRHMP